MKKMRFKIFKYVFSLAFSLLMLAAAGCTSADDPTLPDAAPGTFRIRSRATAQSLGTRAILDPDPLHDSENINSWIVVFYKHSDSNPDVGVIEAICRSEAGATAGTEFSFTPEITDGTYDIAAFANIKEQDLIDAGILTENPVNLEAIRDKELNLTNCPGEPGIYEVPMSGYREDVKIVNKAESGTKYNGKTEVIEVIRLYAKVEIQLQNNSEESLTIDNVDFGYVNVGNVPLFPDYNNLGKDGAASEKAPDILQGHPGGMVADGDKQNIDGLFKSVTLAEDKAEKAVFYVRESVASTLTANGRFYVKLTFTRDGKEPEHHYADLADGLGWITRNDHVIISVPISDITIDWEVIAYPPIGGYPAVIDDDNTLTYTFNTPGKFAIRPIVKYQGQVLTSENMNMTATPDGDDIFKDGPDFKYGELVGEIGSTIGKATLNCTLKVKTDRGEEERTQQLTLIRAQKESDTTP
ncbi:MAG: hypothetical protein Q4C37_05570 [Bacteroidales bacterium]|nr:hypothetical protein [Bacteroidales bacterium]